MYQLGEGLNKNTTKLTVSGVNIGFLGLGVYKPLQGMDQLAANHRATYATRHIPRQTCRFVHQ